jgi:hypothetical protein
MSVIVNNEAFDTKKLNITKRVARLMKFDVKKSEVNTIP